MGYFSRSVGFFSRRSKVVYSEIPCFIWYRKCFQCSQQSSIQSIVRRDHLDLFTSGNISGMIVPPPSLPKACYFGLNRSIGRLQSSPRWKPSTYRYCFCYGHCRHWSLRVSPALKGRAWEQLVYLHWPWMKAKHFALEGGRASTAHRTVVVATSWREGVFEAWRRIMATRTLTSWITTDRGAGALRLQSPQFIPRSR